MYKTIEVDVDLSDFDTEDLIEELELRGKQLVVNNLIEKIWILRREGRDYQTELDKLIYKTLGKIV